MNKKSPSLPSPLQNYEPGTFLDHTVQHISYQDFVHRELILFSRADLERSIPSMLDGLKPGQRKILFACFKRNLKTDIKERKLFLYMFFLRGGGRGGMRLIHRMHFASFFIYYLSTMLDIK